MWASPPGEEMAVALDPVSDMTLSRWPMTQARWEVGNVAPVSRSGRISTKSKENGGWGVSSGDAMGARPSLLQGEAKRDERCERREESR